MSPGEQSLRVNDYLVHMLEATRLARGYVDELSQVEFLQDKRTQQAVILNLITIGEAAARIFQNHNDFVSAHPDIPWHQMRGMRNRMAHGYFDIDLNIVWDTVEAALPKLEARLVTLLES